MRVRRATSKSGEQAQGKKSSMRDAAPAPTGSGARSNRSVDRAAASPDRIALQRGGTAHSPPTLESFWHCRPDAIVRWRDADARPQQQHDPLRIRPYIIHEYYSYVDRRVSVSSHLCNHGSHESASASSSSSKTMAALRVFFRFRIPTGGILNTGERGGRLHGSEWPNNVLGQILEAL